MEIASTICKACQQPIDTSKGRRDRKFCDEGCKNKYHNTQHWEEEREIKRIQLILKKNRRVLKKMSTRKDADTISKERLLKEGFDFGYHTHVIVSKIKSYAYTFCFDYGFRSVNGDTYKIVKAFDYKEDKE